MPAPKGNRNAERVWFRTAGEEKAVKKYVRVSESEAAQVDRVLLAGETFSDLARTAIAAEVAKRLNAN